MAKNKIRKAILLLRFHAIGGRRISTTDASIDAALRWLCHAQDVYGGEGFARAYTLSRGWDLPYPETTGYIIPTFLEQSAARPELNLMQRAWRAGRWLIATQFDSGAICTRVYTPENRTPSVFNTGMVLHGWISLLETRSDDRMYEAAKRAVDWLIAEQEHDGSWVRNAFNHIAHSYYTMVDWALIRYARHFNDERARNTAVKHLDWCLEQRRANGWFERCGFKEGEAVTTHTISYTTQGLLESGRLLNDPHYIDAAATAMEALRQSFLNRGRLFGTFDEQWPAIQK
jgi:uncharacterized protein YyaL (SSP411 family)